MNGADQSEVLAFLASPAAYAFRPQEVRRIRTHAAEIFLVGERAFKVKRAVRYAFLDFSTLAARRRACEEEVRLNVRTAPEIYLGVVAIRRTQDGRLVLDELDKANAGDPVEWVVVMQRFDERLTFDRLADQGALQSEWIDALVDAMVALHNQAEVRGAPYGGSAGLRKVIDENAADMAALPEIFEPAHTAALLTAERQLLAVNASLLDARRDAGQVRRCHGDLHLGNVVLWRDRPMLFDCIEFSEQIATIDVAYDLAFLVMDLEIRGLRPFANRAFSRYFGRQGGVEVLSALPLMLAVRAGVRAKVTAMTLAGTKDAAEAAQLTRNAHRLIEAAKRFAAPSGPPRLVAVGGLSGSGKTTLAAGLAPECGRAPGALLLRSDILRKRLAGVAPEQRLPEAAYTPENNQRVYQTIIQETAIALRAGYCVIADAVFAREEERRSIEAVARATGLDFHGIWLDAPAMALKERVTGRTADASDATAKVVERQLGYDIGEMTWARLEAASGPEAVLNEAKALLALS